MEVITLNNKDYYVKPGEFVVQPHAEYNNLIIYPKVGELERIAGLLNDLVEGRTDATLAVHGWSHGGFLPIECCKVFQKVFVYSKEYIPRTDNLPSNLVIGEEHVHPTVIYIHEFGTIQGVPSNSYVLCDRMIELAVKDFIRVPLTRTNLVLYVPHENFPEFNVAFRYYFDDQGQFDYDNLVHLCIMVKNAGPLFEQVLKDNLPIIDRWTVLDTGSTDGTQDIVRRVLADKKGQLVEEPFINFRDSRNRCLDLAGKNCKYLLMLDDTYAIRYDLRSFLNTVRGDQFASSFSLLILSDDVEYYSNRVTLSERGLRYIYTIHEVIQDTNNKTNVVIPKNAGFIHDYRADYMEKRTMDRKQYDLQLLHDMVRDDPTNPRHYYYLAQTYNLLEDYENASFWFRKRAFTELKGHDQEAVDSCFELARMYNFKMNKPWEECKEIYEKAFEMDKTRPEPLYFIGIHYWLEGKKDVAYEYFKDAFAIGYPIHAQFSLKPTLSFHFLPKFLAPLCYDNKNWQLGLDACNLYMTHNKADADQYEVMQSWHSIFRLLCTLPIGSRTIPVAPSKPNIVFVADGNWNAWTGSDILTKGLGGSETYIVEIARWVQATGNYNVSVFCNCNGSEVFEGVTYLPLSQYSSYIVSNYVHTAIISRYSEYVPLTLEGQVDNVYLVLHDLGPTGVVIPMNDKLKKVLCLTDWHVDYFLERFPSFKGRTESFYYGIDQARFKPSLKVRHSFIYSSFPNRGLLPLLQMWPAIKQAIPDATLNVYSDIHGAWVNQVAKEQMDEIKRLLGTGLPGVTVHGWVSKPALADAWSKADVWFYPCIFQETFCLTALEAAATKTLAVSVPLAALQETVGDRGVLLTGNPMTKEWQDRAVRELVQVLQDVVRKNQLLDKNYQWANSISWKQRGEEFAKKYLDINDSYVGQMGNWVDDLPAGGGHKQIFERTLALAKPQRILEIGTYAGRSLIEMMKRCPDSTGVAIDTWKNYDEEGISILKNIQDNRIEELFYANVKQVGMTHRITALKGDSADRLMELIEQKQRFDFIYVDGSHTCLDCYTDMVLAWKLLVPGGTLAVDDVLYHAEKVKAGDLLGYPLKGKEHFMTKFAGQYDILSDSYRLFVRKR
jgi:tetratricopeptide (TPR) repeat protein/cephalosporin hydroxylase